MKSPKDPKSRHRIELALWILCSMAALLYTYLP